MKTLITGCCGFVGSYLVRHLRSEDPTGLIVCVDRLVPSLHFPNVDVAYSFDLLDFHKTIEILEAEQPDRIVHLASFSSVGYSWEHPLESFQNNTNVFLNILEAVRLVCPRARLLSVGSSEEYGLVHTHELPLREESPLRPLSPYAVARVAQEQLGEVYVRGYGLDIVATRSFNHVGAGQSDKFVVSAIAKQFAELTNGSIKQLSVGTTSVVRDFLDVRDVVLAYSAVLARGKTGEVYNICSGEGIRIYDVIELLKQITNINPAVVIQQSLVRPVENMRVVGSHDKLTKLTGWRPSISLHKSLLEIYHYWLDRTRL